MGNEIEFIWCNRCQRNTGHTRANMNHAPHLLATLLTGGVWIIGWLLFGLFLKDKPWYCLGCGTPYSTPQRKQTNRVEEQDSLEAAT